MLVCQGQWPFESFTSRKLERSKFSLFPEEPIPVSGAFQGFDSFSEVKEKISNDWFWLDNAAPVRAEDGFLVCIGCGVHMENKGTKIDADGRSRKARRCRIAGMISIAGREDSTADEEGDLGSRNAAMMAGRHRP